MTESLGKRGWRESEFRVQRKTSKVFISAPKRVINGSTLELAFERTLKLLENHLADERGACVWRKNVVNLDLALSRRLRVHSLREDGSVDDKLCK